MTDKSDYLKCKISTTNKKHHKRSSCKKQTEQELIKELMSELIPLIYENFLQIKNYKLKKWAKAIKISINTNGQNIYKPTFNPIQ